MKIEDVLDEKNRSRPLLGELLVRRGQIRRYQLDFALRLQEAYQKISRNERLGEIFVDHRVLSDKAIHKALSQQEHLPGDSISQIVSRLNSELDEKIDTVSVQTQLVPK